MKLSKLLLTSTTALGLSMTAAVADNNEALLNQDGADNSAIIDQSAATNSTAGVHGGSNPNSEINQDGDDNDLDFTQIGDSNSIGTGDAFVQDGNQNSANVTQDGDGNNFTYMIQRGGAASSLSNQLDLMQDGDNNRTKEVRQTLSGGSTPNTMSITQDGNDLVAGGRLRQNGNGNSLTIDQSGTNNRIAPANNIVGAPSASPAYSSLNQDGKNNSMNLTQSGTNNEVRQAQQIGDSNTTNADISGMDNGIDPLTTSSATRVPTSLTSRIYPGASGESGAMAGALDQFGNGNNVDLMITGNSNAYGTLQMGDDNLAVNMMVTGDDNSIGVGQYGNRNEIDLAVVDGDENSIGFNQDGDDNFASADVDGRRNNSLIGQDGDRNTTYLEVSGTSNEASLKVTGNDNYLNANQAGRRHEMDVDFQGDDNNNFPTANALSGSALIARDFVRANGDPVAASFRQGDLIQRGNSSNTPTLLTLTGVNADKSSFAMYQEGTANTIVGSISNGSYNQAVVGQIGSFNSASFSQTGSGNNVGIMQ
ncbi:hypothetical protein [Roseovarius sp. SYSU LYC5161]|uniref:hypothetical protein n=1 Tax=Roseovarius halophilus (ex Wu et al. 2025) TaxID=3376060 RepID=UPI00399AADB2